MTITNEPYDPRNYLSQRREVRVEIEGASVGPVINIHVEDPTIEEFRSLLDFAKWLTNTK